MILIIRSTDWSAGLDYINRYAVRNRNLQADDKLVLRFFRVFFYLQSQNIDNAVLEFSSVGNMDKLGPDSSAGGTYVPYNLRVLYAYIPLISKNDFSKAIERFHNVLLFCEDQAQGADFSGIEEILAKCQETLDRAHILDQGLTQADWVARTYRVGLTMAELLIEKLDGENGQKHLAHLIQLFGEIPTLLSLQSKLLLKIGDVPKSREVTDKLECIIPSSEESALVSLNRALIAVHDNKSREAQDIYDLWKSKDPNLEKVCMNNLGVLSAFDGDIMRAISYLENVVRKDPTNVNEIVIQNLFHLYDFYFLDNKERRNIIEELITKYNRNTFVKSRVSTISQKF
eukprot:TRINITY_DN2042_c0_g1_i7.p1 TRINITY_DN2042_c0_g1~~TRINITY_DN2042_c0_g1_i7.p1  ORF type:complete len:343 (+),score=78.30 TRINITY_DN2042_c0_g1_i7:288-1316(+)